MNRFINRVRNADFDLEDALGMMGLARRRSALGSIIPALGFLFAGAAIGAGLGLVFAPSSGRRMRQTVEGRVGQLRDKFKSATTSATGAVDTNSVQG